MEWNKVKELLLADPEMKKEYDALEDEYEEIRRQLEDKINVAEKEANRNVQRKSHDEVVDDLKRHITNHSK